MPSTLESRSPPTPASRTAPMACAALTAATDGQSIGNVADLSAGMRRIEADSNAYYLLSYTTTQSPDGRFHDVQVSIKKPGVRVRTRKGYWAANPDDALRADLLRPRPPPPLEPARSHQPARQAVVRRVARRRRQDPGHVRLGTGPAGAGRANTIGARRPASSSRRSARTARRCSRAPVLPAGPLRPDAADEVQARAIFDAPPGQLRLRMSIEDDSRAGHRLRRPRDRRSAT